MNSREITMNETRYQAHFSDVVTWNVCYVMHLMSAKNLVLLLNPIFASYKQRLQLWLQFKFLLSEIPRYKNPWFSPHGSSYIVLSSNTNFLCMCHLLLWTYYIFNWSNFCDMRCCRNVVITTYFQMWEEVIFFSIAFILYICKGCDWIYDTNHLITYWRKLHQDWQLNHLFFLCTFFGFFSAYF